MDEYSQVNNSRASQQVMVEYLLDKEKNFMYLYDYSKELKKNNIRDEKILDWQLQNAELLKKIGVEVQKNLPSYEEKVEKSKIEDIKDESIDDFFKLNLNSGNYSESSILSNLMRNKHANKFLNKKKLREKSDGNKQKRNRKLSTSQLEINKKYEDESSSEKFYDNTTQSKGKRADSNAIIKNINNCNDEAFENIIKEFLNIKVFPTEHKEKLNLLKKFITIYKKIHSDKKKLNNFLKKISDKLKEPIDDIKSLFEFEYLRSRKEGSFANLSKLFNKFTLFLNSKNVNDLRDFETVMVNLQLKDKLSNMQKKISDYINTYVDVYKFFHKNTLPIEIHFALIEKFNPSFKLKKFMSEEGKDKILKKIKEIFDKNGLIYDENSLINKLIPKVFTEINDQCMSSSYRDPSESDNTNAVKSKYESASIHKSSNNNFHFNNFQINMPPQFADWMKLSQYNVNYDPQNYIINPAILNDNSYMQTEGPYISTNIFSVNNDGVKMPYYSKKYFIKKFDKMDFPDD